MTTKLQGGAFSRYELQSQIMHADISYLQRCQVCWLAMLEVVDGSWKFKL